MLKIDKRLQRLTESGTCSCESSSEYADELRELANKNLTLEKSEAKSKVFKALSDPIRLRILGLLCSREMCVCEVMVALDLTQPTASHHLGILENVELIKKRKEGKCVFFRIVRSGIIENISNTLFNKFTQQ